MKQLFRYACASALLLCAAFTVYADEHKIPTIDGKSEQTLVYVPASDSVSNHICITAIKGDCKAVIFPNNIVTADNVALYITEFGDSLFAGNDSLTRVDMPRSLTRIGKDAFAGTQIGGGRNPNYGVFIDDLDRWCQIDFANPQANPLSNGKASLRMKVFGYTMMSADVVNNSRLYDDSRNSNVVKIPVLNAVPKKFAFYNYVELNNVAFGKNVKSIGDSAFFNNGNLRKVVIENSSIDSIGVSAFESCNRIDTVSFGPRNIFVNKRAFANCGVLSRVLVNTPDPLIVTLADSTCFLKEINGTYPTLHVPFVPGIDTRDVFFQVDQWKCFAQGKKIEYLPYFFKELNSEDVLVHYATYDYKTASVVGADLTKENDYSLNIPAAVVTEGFSAPFPVTSINGYAFSKREVHSLYFPKSLVNIGGAAFNAVVGLNRIVVDGDNPKYDSRENCNGVIETRTNILRIGSNSTIIPNSVTAIGGIAFYNCHGLKDFVLPDSVVSIGRNAFYNCTGLERIVLPASLKTMESGVFAFERGYLYDDVTVSREEKDALLRANVIITDSVETDSAIFKIAILKPEILRKMNIFSLSLQPDSLSASHDAIQQEVFDYCHLRVYSKVIADYRKSPFWGRFKHIEPIDAVGTRFRTTTKEGHFITCETLEGMRCRLVDVDSLSMPVDPNINYNMTLPRNATIYTLTEIADSCFRRVVYIDTLTLPRTITSIGVKAFHHVDSLNAVDMQQPNIFAIDDSCFTEHVYNNARLNVPYGTRALYREAPGWKRFSFITDGKNYMKLKLSSGPFGSVHYNGLGDDVQSAVMVPFGAVVNVSAVPDAGYETDSFFIDNKLVTDKLINNTYSFVARTDSVEIRATFVHLPANGDVNLSGTTDVQDATIVARHIMNPSIDFDSDRQVWAYDSIMADVRPELGVIDVFDVMGIIYIVLHPESDATGGQSAARFHAEEQADNAHYASPTAAFTSSESLVLSFADAQRFTSLQMDITLPEGKSLRSVSLLGQSSGDHSVSFNSIAPGTYRVIVFSMSSAALPADGNRLLRFAIDDDQPTATDGKRPTVLSGMTFITLDADAVQFCPIVVNSDSATGITSISSDDGAPARITDLQGRRINAGKSLKKGIYIVNDKKITVK